MLKFIFCFSVENLLTVALRQMKFGTVKYHGHVQGLFVRFQVLTALGMKYGVFWDVLPRSQVDVDRRSEVRTAAIIIGVGGSMHL
jgi:hypothetical protein